jgi:type IV pilus biogenesis protein CpaD/CtpE
MSRWSLVLAGLILASACSDAEPFVPEQPPTSAAIVRIEVSVAESTLEIGDTTSAMATAYAEDGTALPLVSFTWSSSDSTVATVTPKVPSEGATVSAVSLGVTSLLAGAGGVSSAAVPITVAEPEVPAGVGGPSGP